MTDEHTTPTPTPTPTPQPSTWQRYRTLPMWLQVGIPAIVAIAIFSFGDDSNEGTAQPDPAPTASATTEAEPEPAAPEPESDDASRNAYIDEVLVVNDTVTDALNSMAADATMVGDGTLSLQRFAQNSDNFVTTMEGALADLESNPPPPAFEDSHSLYISAIESLAEGGRLGAEGARTDDPSLILEAVTYIDQGGSFVYEAIDALNTID